jgi:hypothetical protein
MYSRTLATLAAFGVMLLAAGCGGVSLGDATGGPQGSIGSQGSTFTSVAPGSPSPPKALVKPQAKNARTSMFVAGNASPVLPIGKPGVVALVSEGARIDQSGSLPIVVRNNTSHTVARITASGTIQNASGKLIATGSDQGFKPNVVQPGEIAFGYIYFQNFNLAIPPGGKVSVQLGSTAASQDAYENIRELKVENTNLTGGEFGKQILGQAVDQYRYRISGPIGVDVACFDKTGRVLDVDSDFASPDNLASGQTASYTVSLTSRCPVYLVAASGFTS